MVAKWSACAVAVGSLAGAAPAAGQVWNSAPTRALVERATDLRARQLADTGLVDYHATAHGYVMFLAQLGDANEPPKIVKADQLALEVYWRAPNFSKQIIEGRRDTLLLPTDIAYHRDHLGIVQNNFPASIRLGEGDEVRDVPHPLSAPGLRRYDFAIDDSLRITLPPPAPPVTVYRVRVRPRDARAPGIVGAVYIEPRVGQVVRMAFSFTRAAMLDADLEDISVVLENGLIDGRFWLPRRQEIEIRRTATWLDLPVRGIIRGRWEICCYRINQGLDTRVLLGGPEIVSASPDSLRRYPWRGGILDSLPGDARTATDADIARVRGVVVAHARPTALSARALSDFIRFDRVEGLAVGGGLTHRLGHGLAITGRARYGVDDGQGKGEVDLSWRRGDGAGITLAAYRDFRDVGDVAEGSVLINSLAAQEFGADHTDPYDTRGAAVFVTAPPWAGLTWRLGLRREAQDSLRVRARPVFGHDAPTVPAASVWETMPTLTVTRPTAGGPFGTEWRAEGELRGDWGTFARAALALEVEHPFGSDRLVTRTTLAGVTAGWVPPQDEIYVGGPVSGPGYAYHQFVARAAATEHVEWRFPVPAPSIDLGRYGKTPGTVTLAPYAHLVVSGRGGAYPAIGMGLLTVFDLARFDVAKGLRGGSWTFAFDVSRDLWPVF